MNPLRDKILIEEATRYRNHLRNISYLPKNNSFYSTHSQFETTNITIITEDVANGYYSSICKDTENPTTKLMIYSDGILFEHERDNPSNGVCKVGTDGILYFRCGDRPSHVCTIEQLNEFLNLDLPLDYLTWSFDHIMLIRLVCP